jgi:hypothetical protein
MTAFQTPMIAMRRLDGNIDSEVHLEGLVAKPDPTTGHVLIPATFVLAMLQAGYFWSNT